MCLHLEFLIYYHHPNIFVLDNNVENKSISVRYNEFLNSYDYSIADWFVFCHEDWELKENLSKKLKNLDKNCLYGPIGTKITKKKNILLKYFLGRIIHSNKDGSNAISLGLFCRTQRIVSTFDCQCLVVHSSLIQKYNLRFDPNLNFDLYVEDFCIYAKENHQIESRILQMKCQHYSYGNVQQRFFDSFEYLKNKYISTTNLYGNTVTDEVIGNHNNLTVKYISKTTFPSVKTFIFNKKVTSKGKLLIKICKIPVVSIRLKSNITNT